MLAPPPLPLQASVSDIASAFGLESSMAPPPIAPLGGSPMRRTRSSRVSDLSRQPSLSSSDSPSNLDRFAPLPLHPSQSMANSGLDALEALPDLEPCAELGADADAAPLPMRRTRSKALPALPLQPSISELVSSFITDCNDPYGMGDDLS